MEPIVIYSATVLILKGIFIAIIPISLPIFIKTVVFGGMWQQATGRTEQNKQRTEKSV